MVLAEKQDERPLKWKDLRVGDVLLSKVSEPIVIVACSEPDNLFAWAGLEDISAFVMWVDLESDVWDSYVYSYTSLLRGDETTNFRELIPLSIGFYDQE